MESLFIENPIIAGSAGNIRISVPIECSCSSYTLEIDCHLPNAIECISQLADAYLALVLPFALSNSFNIVSKCPLSSETLYLLHDFLIPVLARVEHMPTIQITSPHIPTNTKQNYLNAAALAINYNRYGLYTFLKHQISNFSTIKYAVVHSVQSEFTHVQKLTEDFEKFSVSLMSFSNNAKELFSYSDQTHRLFSHIAYARLLSQHIDRYYIPSSHFIDEYKVSLDDVSYAELFFAFCFSTQCCPIDIANIEISDSQKDTFLNNLGQRLCNIKTFLEEDL